MSGMLTCSFRPAVAGANVTTDVEFAEVRYSGSPRVSPRIPRDLPRNPDQLIILGWVNRAMIKVLTIRLASRRTGRSGSASSSP